MTAGTSAYPISDFEPYRRELTEYCYRMLGSAFDAERITDLTFFLDTARLFPLFGLPDGP